MNEGYDIIHILHQLYSSRILICLNGFREFTNTDGWNLITSTL